MAGTDNNYTLGRGEIHFAKFTSGTIPGEFRYIGNTPDFNFTIDSEELEHFSSDGGIREKDCSITLEVTRTGGFVTDNVDVDNMGLFLFGDAETVTTVAAAGQVETLTIQELGNSFKLGLTAVPGGYMGIDEASVVVEDTGGAGTTYVAGTDYTVDADNGFITILDTGTIAPGTVLDITYDVRGSTRDRVTSGDAAIEGALLYIAKNPAGQQLNYYLPYVKLTPNGDFNLKGDEFQQLPFNTEILKATGQEAIYLDGTPVYA